MGTLIGIILGMCLGFLIGMLSRDLLDKNDTEKPKN